MNKSFTDEQIIQGIEQGGKLEPQYLEGLYFLGRDRIFAMVLRNQGSEAEAMDVLQEAVIAVYENIKTQKFKKESKLLTYLYSIARFNWLNRLKRKKREQQWIGTQNEMEVNPGHLPQFLRQDQRAHLLKWMEQVGSDCKQVLILSIYQQYSMKEIADQMQYEGEQVARNKKYKCLKKLKQLLVKHPEIRNLME